jgi:hypothetical protein
MEFFCEKTSCKLSKTACAARYKIQNAAEKPKKVSGLTYLELFTSGECVNCTLGKKHLSEIGDMFEEKEDTLERTVNQKEI